VVSFLSLKLGVATLQRPSKLLIPVNFLDVLQLENTTV